MEDRQDSEDADLITVGSAIIVEKSPAPPAKKRRLVKVADKGGASSSSVISTRSSLKSVVDVATVEAEAAAGEAEEAEAAAPLRRKTRKAKVPFYYDKKTFAVSASTGFVKRLEKENWKDFMSFVKDNAAPLEPIAEESADHGVTETDLSPPEIQEVRDVTPVQDPRPDVVVAEPVLQLELRPDVVVKKSKRSSIGKVPHKFLIKSRVQRYVKRNKV